MNEINAMFQILGFSIKSNDNGIATGMRHREARVF